MWKIQIGGKCIRYSLTVNEGNDNLIIINGSIVPSGSYDKCTNDSSFMVILSLILLFGIIIFGCCCYCRRRQANRAKLIMYNQQQLEEKTNNYI
ncbi:unnamed protein product [Rotaria sp. Silwood2]|nr:unnamed protein product [Rotaria sp. Silwood2]CAF3085805.1 unnamed protein product [Rotaria sp. Silwood2]CAF4225130.1 unnamed protein product [Rotaria sp. Silwood2]CAF4245119.1 unnamed protein product [Rotaria sp. Silwood2]